MRIFVTGGTGFVGTNFLGQALEAGHRVLALRRGPASLPRLPLPTSPEWLTKEMGDVTPADLQGNDCLVHFAAAGVNSKASWEECFRVNTTESIGLWLAAAEAGIRQFVICGSCFEYGRSGERLEQIPADAPLEPTGPYHASKAAATMAAMALAVDQQVSVSVLRPFHVFGEGEGEQRFWPSLRRAALAGEDFLMTAGEQVRDFIPVEAVARRFLHACEERGPQPGHSIIQNIGTGHPQTLRDFAEHWWQRWGAAGRLCIGEVPYRNNEVMRYVPRL